MAGDTMTGMGHRTHHGRRRARQLIGVDPPHRVWPSELPMTHCGSRRCIAAYLSKSTSLVSGRKKSPTKKDTPAITIGYQSPA
jgi:hypothetical protein